MKKIVTAILCITAYLLPASDLCARVVHARFSGGFIMPRLTNSSTLLIYPDLLNQYQTRRTTRTGGVWGGAIDLETTPFNNQPLSLSVGLAAYALDYRHVTGDKYPFVNEGEFDSSLYSFGNKSSTGFIEGRAYYTLSTWKPFLIAGVGSSKNHAYNYQEIPFGLAVANQNLRHGYQHSSAYEAGIGVEHSLFQNASGLKFDLALEYRYFNTGKSSLRPFISQGTSERLQINHLETDALLLTLSATYA